MDGTRALQHLHYGISAQLTEKAEALATMKEQAGCFVLISNVAPQGPLNAQVPYDGKMILKAYKDLNGIEHNFGFLKDPVLVNAILLKEPERIEALGLILVISLSSGVLSSSPCANTWNSARANCQAGTRDPRNVPQPS